MVICLIEKRNKREEEERLWMTLLGAAKAEEHVDTVT